MSDIIQSTLEFLRKEKINLDKEEFLFQYKSHPDHPSILALSDTLFFFNISNGAIKVKDSELDSLPSRFVALVKEEEGMIFKYIERRNRGFKVNGNFFSQKKISLNELKSKWGEVVFLVENNGKFKSRTKKSKGFERLLLIISLLLFGLILYQKFQYGLLIPFISLSFIGIYLSIGAVKVSLNQEDEFLTNLCGLIPNSSDSNSGNNINNSNCNTVIGANKWKVFNYVNFTDLSLTFFLTQLISLTVMTLSEYYFEFVQIQLLLLLLSLPVILVSIFYQKFIVKSWCTLCLGISGVLVFEFLILIKKGSSTWTIANFEPLVLFLFIYSLTFLLWLKLKFILFSNADYKQEEIKLTKLKKNYSLFKQALISQTKNTFPSNSIFFGNLNSSLRIDFLLNPYCGHCKRAHEIGKGLINDLGSQILVTYNFGINLEKTKNNGLERITKNLIHIQNTKGNQYFFSAVDNWYEERDEEKWLNQFESDFNEKEIKKSLKAQYHWTLSNGLNFTPYLQINGFKFPTMYDVTDLPFFINEILDDSDF